MDSEMKSFQGDLLASVRQMQRSEVARVTEVKWSPVAEARASVCISWQQFAKLLTTRIGTQPDGADSRSTSSRLNHGLLPSLRPLKALIASTSCLQGLG